MFAKLTGLLDSKGDSWVVIDVGGVGYLVQCGTRTINEIPVSGSSTTVFIETVVREDAFLLYGFLSTADRDWFRLLLKVKNVGARVALGILSSLPPENLSNAIAANDRNALTLAPGVGPKLAERIISELKDKVIFSPEINVEKNNFSNSKDHSRHPLGSEIIKDTVSALTNLGYSPAESVEVVRKITQHLEEKIEIKSLLRMSLKELSK